MIFPSKYSLLATTSRNCVHYISAECGASTLHSPVAMPMVSAGRCPVGSGLQWSRCDLLHFYRPVIRQAAPLHTTTPLHRDIIGIWALGNLCLFYHMLREAFQ